MTTTPGPELVVPFRAEVGEGPLWDARDGSLYWVDMAPGRLYRWRPHTGSELVLDAGQTLGSVALRNGGGLLLALRDGVYALDPGSGTTERLVDVHADSADLWLNDSACDPAGRLWVGSVFDEGTSERGCLYRIGPDLGVTRAMEDTVLANGLAWSPDGTTMYVADSTVFTVFEADYDVGTGEASARRPFVVVEPEAGQPDGLTVDADGFVWVAFWGGWCVRRYSPDGRLDRVVRLPVAQVTSCTFGGAHLDQLFITTAACELTREEAAAQPTAGSVYRIRPGVRGLATAAFGG